MKNGKHIPIAAPSELRMESAPRARYDCSRCPGYCCSYPLIEIGRRDVARLARHFGLEYAEAEERFTKFDAAEGVRALRHRRDTLYKTACIFLDPRERRCTAYAARPGVCRDYPDRLRCGYYEFLKFEREQQGDPKFIATA